TDEGHPEAVANPRNVFSGAQSGPKNFVALVLPLLRSRAFLMVCLLGFAATMVRETFNTWNALYLRDFLGYSISHSAALSAIFPGVGAISVLLAGWASDRLGPNARSLLLVLGLASTAVALLILTSLRPAAAGVVVPVAMTGIVAFCLLGPYSFLPGAFALDFGGKQAGAVASGLVDGTGYLGGVLAGYVMARIAVAFGWGGVFITLAVVSALGALGACYLYVLNARHVAAPLQ
ncbi:MAG TPA: MFS transporter, partial [Steroidobacteraceae bacterium]|nr:MFS transporter [Steroidobacteraceae bacterium]